MSTATHVSKLKLMHTLAIMLPDAYYTHGIIIIIEHHRFCSSVALILSWVKCCIYALPLPVLTATNSPLLMYPRYTRPDSPAAKGLGVGQRKIIVKNDSYHSFLYNVK